MTTEDRTDEAIDRLQRVLQGLGDQQVALDRRLGMLSRLALFDLLAVVLSISILVVVLSLQAPDLRKALATMNVHIASMSDDLYSIRGSMHQLTDDVGSLSGIIAQVDGIHGDVSRMRVSVGTMTERVTGMNTNLTQVSAQVGDMSQSFGVLDHTLYRMMLDVNHMSKPMRFFNQMNPFR